MPPNVPLKAVALTGLLSVTVGSTAHSQQAPAPPTPHTQPVLPGTHVPPSQVPQKLAIGLRIEAPTTVNQKMCAQHTFGIKYTLTNNTTKLANGTIQAAFNGVRLQPVGSAKVTNLPPGKAAIGAFTACCPSTGSFTASMDYHGEPSTTNAKLGGSSNDASDSLTIRCASQ